MEAKERSLNVFHSMYMYLCMCIRGSFFLLFLCVWANEASWAFSLSLSLSFYSFRRLESNFHSLRLQPPLELGLWGYRCVYCVEIAECGAYALSNVIPPSSPHLLAFFLAVAPGEESVLRASLSLFFFSLTPCATSNFRSMQTCIQSEVFFWKGEKFIIKNMVAGAFLRLSRAINTRSKWSQCNATQRNWNSG